MCSSTCPDRPLVTDEICGNFNTTPPVTAPLVVYSVNPDAGVFPYGTVSVYYDRGTAPAITVTVTPNDTTATPVSFTVPRSNTISQTFNDIGSVSIDTASAIGKFSLDIHYEV